MRILIKIVRFIFVFFIFSFGMSIVRDARIPLLIYLWIVVGCGYVGWEFGGFLKKKDKSKNIKMEMVKCPEGFTEKTMKKIMKGEENASHK